VLRLRTTGGEPINRPLDRVLVTRNRTKEGLGLALPAGKLALFGTKEGRRILLGEGRIDDHTIDQKVEIKVASATGVWAVQQRLASREVPVQQLTLSSSLPRTETVEVELPLSARAVTGGTLVKRDGWMLWRVSLPPGASRSLRYRF
jgi:hypothetical protein